MGEQVNEKRCEYANQANERTVRYEQTNDRQADRTNERESESVCAGRVSQREKDERKREREKSNRKNDENEINFVSYELSSLVILYADTTKGAH